MSKYLDILTLMKERTADQIRAFATNVNSLHIYEGQGICKEVTQSMRDFLEQQQVDLDYLISRETAHE